MCLFHPSHHEICALHQIITELEDLLKREKISMTFATNDFPTWLIASCVITFALGGEGLKMSPCLAFRKNVKSIPRQLRPAMGISSCTWIQSPSAGSCGHQSLILLKASSQMCSGRKLRCQGRVGTFHQHCGHFVASEGSVPGVHTGQPLTICLLGVIIARLAFP